LWLAITTPFSSWRGASLQFVVDMYRSFIFAAVIIGLTTEMDQVYKLIRIIAYSIMIGAVLSFFFGELSYGRLILPRGTFRDPNQYAMTLLLSLPLWLWIAKGLSFPAVLAPFVCLIPIFIAFLRAGSRGAAIGLAAFCAVQLWQASLARKAILFFMMVVVVGGAIAVLPTYLKERYFTLFNADTTEIADTREKEMLAGGDVGSSHARLALLLTSIDMTLAHPLFGVGAGQFPYQAWVYRAEHGQPRMLATQTHNTFTEVSSELGIPALVIFLGLVISSFRALRSVLKLKSSSLYRLPQRVIDTAEALLLTMVVLTVCSCFLSLTYGPLFFVIPAIIAVFCRAVQNDLPGWRIDSIAAPPVAIRAAQRPPAGPVPGLGPGLRRPVSYRK
jgi:O-antigen ligase